MMERLYAKKQSLSEGGQPQQQQQQQQQVVQVQRPDGSSVVLSPGQLSVKAIPDGAVRRKTNSTRGSARSEAETTTTTTTALTPGAYRVSAEGLEVVEDTFDDEDFASSSMMTTTTSNSRSGVPSAVPGTIEPTNFYDVEARSVLAEESPPPPLYPAETVNIDKENRKQRRRFVILIVLVVLALVAVVVSVVVAVLQPGSGSPSNDSTTSSPSASPTFTGDDTVRDFLASQSPDGGLAFQDPNSVQSQALAWLLDPTFNRRLTATQHTVQRYVLAVLYLASHQNGNNVWANEDNWLTSADVCSWYTSGTRGGLCNDDGLVEQLDLNRNNVRGPLPSELSMLSSQLVVLDMTLNRLTGTLPTELGLLTKAEIFFVGANLLAGTIPTELGQLSSVTKLYVDGNDFVGTVGPQVCSLRNQTLELFWGDCQEIDCPCCTRCCTDGSPCNE